MAHRHTLQASVRTVLGKETAKLRRQGIAPGVIYGPVISEPLSISVDLTELDRMYHAYGSNALIDLKLDGSTYTVYMRHVQMDRLQRRPLHAEFFAPNMRVEITASIPVMHVGEPGDSNGVVTHGHDSLELRGLPDALPPAIEVNLSTLTEIDQAIHAGDIALPAGVQLLTDPEIMIVKLGAPTLQIEVEEEEAAEVELEEAAEAGGAEAEAQGEAGTALDEDES
jgi:large subunit ribosomal protein L25